MKMKSKIKSFIMMLISLLVIAIIAFFGVIFYNEFVHSDITSDVQEFISNMTVYGGGIDENVAKPQIIEKTIDTLEPSKENVKEDNQEIDKYYYSQLDEYSKKIYKAMYSNKENMKTGTYEINLGTQFSNLLSQSNGEELLGEYYQSAIEAYTYDNPDVFYIEFNKLYLNIETTTRTNVKSYRVFINAGNNTNYLTKEFSSKEKIDTALNEIEKVEMYFTQNQKENTYENIKSVHDYLVESIDYEQTISKDNIYNIYGALINKECVCEGYAKSFKYLMDCLNIPCVVVAGKATTSEGGTENHAWNYVQIEHNWYAIDCTWDDPVIIGVGIVGNTTKYKYFLKGEKEFNESHFQSGQFTENGKMFEYPILSSTNYR